MNVRSSMLRKNGFNNIERFFKVSKDSHGIAESSLQPSELCLPEAPLFVEIDTFKFQKTSGNLKWLPVIAAAFLRQLPQWHTDFAVALAEQNTGHQIDLLHKLKGACQAVAAYRIIQEISHAEAIHALGERLMPSRLLNHLEVVASELRTIVANAPDN